MLMRVQVVDGEYRVGVPPEAVEALGLRDGFVVELESVEQTCESTQRYFTREEGLEAFRRTEHLHANSYRELAKGLGAAGTQGL